jgi:hypothetical protein
MTKVRDPLNGGTCLGTAMSIIPSHIKAVSHGKLAEIPFWAMMFSIHFDRKPGSHRNAFTNDSFPAKKRRWKAKRRKQKRQ